MSEFDRGFDWIALSKLGAGDYIHRWGDDLQILANEKVGDGFRLTVLETDGKEAVFEYEKDSLYIARHGELESESQ